MAKRTIKINIKLPSGITATKELADTATKAAKSAVDSAVGELAEVQKVAKELASKGITISTEELMSRKTKASKRGKKKAAGTASKKAKSGARKRVVLSDAKKDALVADLKANMKIAEAAKKYGVSTATVMNIKSGAGLTKPKKKKA